MSRTPEILEAWNTTLAPLVNGGTVNRVFNNRSAAVAATELPVINVYARADTVISAGGVNALRRRRCAVEISIFGAGTATIAAVTDIATQIEQAMTGSALYTICYNINLVETRYDLIEAEIERLVLTLYWHCNYSEPRP